MPAMPFEQLVVAFATYWTVVATLLLWPGAETQTPAYTKLVKHTSTHNDRSTNFIEFSSFVGKKFRELYGMKDYAINKNPE